MPSLSHLITPNSTVRILLQCNITRCIHNRHTLISRPLFSRSNTSTTVSLSVGCLQRLASTVRLVLHASYTAAILILYASNTAAVLILYASNTSGINNVCIECCSSINSVCIAHQLLQQYRTAYQYCMMHASSTVIRILDIIHLLH